MHKHSSTRELKIKQVVYQIHSSGGHEICGLGMRLDKVKELMNHYTVLLASAVEKRGMVLEVGGC